MDLLDSLGLADVPEQQTRLLLDAPDALSLGFDACCTCGTSLIGSSVVVSCAHCRRVAYCSEACRERDARGTSNNPDDDDEDPQPDALGHSAIICSLLQLCAADEAIEDGTTATKTPTPTSTNAALFTTTQAARDRVRSEYESYPATLANVLMEGPCYQAVLAQKEIVVIHIIGASDDAELSTGPTSTGIEGVLQAYADSLAEWVDRNSTAVRQIVLQFIGPECPTDTAAWNQEVPLQLADQRVGTLRVSTHCGLYHEVHLTTPPDIVVWFHPGFTVPDYQWVDSVQCVPHGTPFLLTSNTEMEVIADTQFLLEQDCIQQLPAGLADVLEVVVESSGEQAFCTVNPFAGLRVRQNGSLANDVYVKNRWMLGGVIGPLLRPDAAASSNNAKRARHSSRPNAALI